MRSITIVNCLTNLGLIEPLPGKHPGVIKLPFWLKKYGLHEVLKPIMVYELIATPYTMNIDGESGVRNADAIISFAKEQADLLAGLLTTDTLPFVVGGDCSVLIGNALALKGAGNYALFFLDGHTDFSWPGLSQTAGAAGMDLAIVTGNAHEKLANINGLGPCYIKEENAWSFGNRDYEIACTDAINGSCINYYDLKRLRSEGIDHCVCKFLSAIDTCKVDGFWIHVDVDVLDDNLMFAVDSRQPGGLSYDEFNKILAPLVTHQKLSGIELTILDPDLDIEGTCAKLLIKAFEDIFKQLT